MSAETLFDEQANLSPDDEMERGGDEQIVRKLFAGGLLRRRRLRRLLLARLPARDRTWKRTRAAKRKKAAVRITSWRAC